MGTPWLRPSSILPLITALGALTYTAPARSAVTTDISDTDKGGLAVDGWGDNGDELTFVSGQLHIRIPLGATVKKAILYSSVGHNTTNVPVGPMVGGNILHRQVELGTPTVATLVLEGAPNREAISSYALFSMDVTTQLKPLIETMAGTAPGGEVLIPVRERGDNATVGYFYPKILGHTLVVEYTHPDAPMRRLVVYAGSIAQSGTDTAIALPGALGLSCNMPGSPGYEGVTMSLMYPWEISCADYNTVRINGNVFATRVSGDDDGYNGRACPRRAGAVFDFNDLRSLFTVGSFGGRNAAAGIAPGASIGVKGDVVFGAPPTTGEDDELYDIQPQLANGATTFGIRYGGTGNDEVINIIALQGAAAMSATDADGDGILDAVEGGCVDTDGDGKPDYLDTDSDNDCAPDATDSNRTSAMAPRPNANDNCSGATPVCDTTVGRCVPDQDTDSDGILNLVEISLGTNPLLADSDGDGIPDNVETSAAGSTGPFIRIDTDNDGVIDALDLDSDGDSLSDRSEAGATTAMPRDTDADGIPDYRDTDDDNDTIPTLAEVTDSALPGLSTDVDTDGIVNWLDTDSDSDGRLDSVELRGDLDGDGKPSYLDANEMVVSDAGAGSGANGAAEAGSAGGSSGNGTPAANSNSAGPGAALEGGGISCAFHPNDGAAAGIMMGLWALVTARTASRRARARSNRSAGRRRR